MEGFAVLFGLGLLALMVGLPIWIVASIRELRRRAEADHLESSQHWNDLSARVHVLETAIRDIRSQSQARAGVEEPHTAAQGAAYEVKLPAPTTPLSAPEPAKPATPLPAVTPLPVPAGMAPPAPAPPKPAPVPPQTPAPVITHPIPSPQSPPRAEVPPSSLRSSFDLEETLGTNWLNKLGIAILVLGLAFFLAYQLHNLGPGGKVLLGLVLSAAMIAVGIRYESSDRYRILARASAAGGWSLLYFISYAVYHVPAAHILDSRELDLLLMLAVAVAILWYSLRYRSQATTTLALGLSYLTVGIHNTSFLSLAASAILAVTVVALALRMQWFALEGFGIVATYFNHFLWVSPIVERMGGTHAEFPEFRVSMALLGFYWLLFRISYIYRSPSDEAQERLSTAAALINGFLLLALLRYQSVHPEWTFWTLLVLGAIELALAGLSLKRRRIAFVVLATLGSALIVAAFPFRYSGSDLSILWLVAAETFLLAGVFTRESVFRRVGLSTMVLVAGQMVLDTAAPLVDARLSGAIAPPAYSTAVLFAFAALLCYFNSRWVGTRWPELFTHDYDVAIVRIMTYLGGLLALLAAWFAFPGAWTAVAWAALALVMDALGKRFKQPSLAVQGNVIALTSILRLVTLNFFDTEQWHGMSVRLITVSLTAALLYAAAPLAGAADEGNSSLWNTLAAAHTWAASIFLGVLIWYEVSSLKVVLAWAILGIVLLELGLRLKAGFLRWQASTALIASFIRIFYVNIDAAGAPGQVSPRIMTLAPLAIAYLYCEWRLRRPSAASRATGVLDLQLQVIASVFSYLGVATIAALLYAEVQPAWIAASWAAMALVLVAVALWLRRADYLHQAFLMAFAVALRALSYNFVQPSAPVAAFWQTQKSYVGVACALLLAALPFAFALRRSSSGNGPKVPLDAYPEQVFFFIPFGLITGLIALEASRGRLTLTWGFEGVIVFLFALLVGERSFRLAGLGLLLLCVAKIFSVDVWGLDPESRYITFIVLGAALVLVSFLYTRHKEKFRQYL